MQPSQLKNVSPQTSPQSFSDLSIVLVNYKTVEVTSITLALIEEAIDVSQVPVYVVDNNSNDASLVHLKSLDWIHLIERRPEGPEVGYMAHGRALDLALAEVKTKYVLLLHTDTFIYDATIIQMMLDALNADNKIAAIGCLEQVQRTRLETVWRVSIRACKYYLRRIKVALGMKTREPRLFYEVYLKSFCTLWNVDIIKQHGLSFAMVDRIPGYEMQDRLPELGYRFSAIHPRKIFQYLDHIEAGTVAMVNKYGKEHKRIRNYQAMVDKIHARKK